MSDEKEHNNNRKEELEDTTGGVDDINSVSECVVS